MAELLMADAALPFTIIHVPHDEAGIRKYLNDYRAFRLLSLQIAPEAFASNYAREIAVDDDTWYRRLSSPGANTFMAFDESGQTISFSSMMGPLPYGPDGIPPLGHPWEAIQGQDDPQEHGYLHFRLSGIFTLPEARRKGVSKILIERAIGYTIQALGSKTKKVVFSVLVETENAAAKALYESVGFDETKRMSASETNIGHNIVLLEYRPSFVATKSSGS